MKLANAALVSLSLALAACGGGDGAGGTPISANPNPNPNRAPQVSGGPLAIPSAGIVTTPISSGIGTDTVAGIAVDGAGRIFVGGNSTIGASARFALACYTADGVLDGTFGGGGIVTTPIGPEGDHAGGIVLDGSDRILVAGSSYSAGISVAGETVQFTIPAGHFIDPDGDVLTYTATLDNGDALPASLKFNPSTRTFTGSVPSAAPGVAPRLKVTARDPGGLSVSDTLRFTASG